jgi:hypothetical protein
LNRVRRISFSSPSGILFIFKARICTLSSCTPSYFRYFSYTVSK